VYFLFVICLVVSTCAIDCLERLVSEMTCYVSHRTLNSILTHSLRVSTRLMELGELQMKTVCIRLCIECKRWRHAFVEVETLQQAGLLQSLPQSARRTRQARTLLSMYVKCFLHIARMTEVSALLPTVWRKVLLNLILI